MTIRRFDKVLPLLIAALFCLLPRQGAAQTANLQKILDRLDQLEKKQASMEQEMKAKDARINELQAELDETKRKLGESKAAATKVISPVSDAPAAVESAAPTIELADQEKPALTPARPDLSGYYLSEMGIPDAPAIISGLKATYSPGKGFRVFSRNWGEMNIAIYSYARYLNQLAMDDTYTDSFGRTFDIDTRNDLQLAKLQIKFAGWLGNPKFRYYLWAWTSNANMGQGAQVVLGGTLSYLLNPHFSIGGGIAALPTTRSTRGNFPFWLRVDARPIADEYFRGSYTTGLFAWGDIAKGFHYKTMIGNNLSQLGIDAGQLDNAFQTIATSVWWASENYGAMAGYGDFEHHDKLAMSFGGAYTYSRESKQSQPGAEDPENTQLRISDGTAIFARDAFGPGLQIDEATYQMTALDGSFKYKGFSFDYDYFFRRIGSLASEQQLPVKNFFDHGLDAQASYMVVPKILQIYGFGSKIFGQYGNPWELGGGFNVFPLKNRAMRFNIEGDYVHRSPVGYLAYPTPVGGTGPLFMLNFELNL